MDVEKLLNEARDTMTVKRVFGEPIEKDGLTMIPVANVMGGGGGGSGPAQDDALDASNEDERGGGAGVGFGVRATPAGMYVIKGGDVRWEPALNLNRVILGGQILGAILVVTIGAIIRAARDNGRK